MSISIQSWKPFLAHKELLRRLRLIHKADGFNTDADVEASWTYPEDIDESLLPAIRIVEMSMEPDESAEGGAYGRGTWRMAQKFQIWGTVQSQDDLAKARHELIADVKSAIWINERLASADGTEFRALFVRWNSLETDGGAMADIGRSFFALEISIMLDMVRQQ